MSSEYNSSFGPLLYMLCLFLCVLIWFQPQFGPWYKSVLNLAHAFEVNRDFDGAIQDLVNMSGKLVSDVLPYVWNKWVCYGSAVIVVVMTVKSEITKVKYEKTKHKPVRVIGSYDKEEKK